MVMGRAYQPPQRRPMDLACHHLEAIYDKKRRQGRPAKRWRDDLDKYWSDTIWQRTAQDRLTWRRHAEAFETACWGLRPTTGHNGYLVMMMMTCPHDLSFDFLHLSVMSSFLTWSLSVWPHAHWHIFISVVTSSLFTSSIKLTLWL